MALSRRAFGVGLLGAGVVGTGGYFAVRDRPELQGLLGSRTTLFGFVAVRRRPSSPTPKLSGRSVHTD